MNQLFTTYELINSITYQQMNQLPYQPVKFNHKTNRSILSSNQPINQSR